MAYMCSNKKVFNFVLMILLFAPSILEAQNVKSIKWIHNLSWKELKSKAKDEDKFIFIDCYTTWCGPCKRMEDEVYETDSVADLVNSLFLPVKVQMDKTNHDNDEIKKFYSDAENIGKEFKVNAYPTLIFLSSDGNILVKQVGYKNPQDFLILAKNAVTPGTKFNDPFKRYDSLISEYHNGKNVYREMIYLIKTSKQLDQIALADSLSSVYNSYLLKLPVKQLYMKDNLEFLSNNIKMRTDKAFKLFYLHGKRVNKILNEKDYSLRVVDRVVRIEIVNDFLEKSLNGNIVPNWDSLYQLIKHKYSKEIATREILGAKVKWYELISYTKSKENIKYYLKQLIFQVKKYGQNAVNISLVVGKDTPFDVARDLTLNDAAWKIFNTSNDKEDINTAIEWMKDVVARSPKSGLGWQIATTDTYANLLYKVGRKNDAIHHEEKVIAYAEERKDAKEIKQFVNVLNKMKDGTPTWH